MDGEGFFDGHVRLKRHAGVRHLQAFALAGLHDAVRSVAGNESRVAREFRRVRKIFDAERPPEIGPFRIGNWRRQCVQRGHCIVGIICSFPDVQEPHNLRTRSIGNRIAIEFHIRMDGNLSLNKVHERATSIERKLKDRFGNRSHIIIHMEPIK